MKKNHRRGNWNWNKNTQSFVCSEFKYFDVKRVGGSGTLNPLMVSYTDPKGVRVMFSAEPDWFWLRHTLETKAKDFMKNPHKFKAIVGWFTCKKTGKYKPKTIKPFLHLEPRKI